jgi:hypothetical protein
MTRSAGMQRKIGDGALSRFNAARGSASGLLDHLNPKFESQVFALRISELKAKLFLVVFMSGFQVQRNELCEVLYVVAIALDIVFDNARS